MRAVKKSFNLLTKHIAGKELYRIWPCTAKEVTDLAISLIKKHYKKRPFFLLVHYWDTHLPYNYSKIYYKKFIDEYSTKNRKMIKDIILELNGEWSKKLIDFFELNTTLGEVLAMYDAAMANIDSEIRRLVYSLENLGLMDKTFIIFTSDHGESLNEHGIYFDHHGLYEVSIQVPLVIVGPNIPRSKRVRNFVQHVDIMPTILDLLNIKTNIYQEGISLHGLMNNEPSVDEAHRIIYAEENYTQRKFSIRIGKYKYIMALHKNKAKCNYCGYIHGGIEELYNLESDPNETNNIVEENPDVVKEMKNILIYLIRKYRLADKLYNIKQML